MKVRVDFVEQQDDLPGDPYPELFRGANVLAPRPDQHVGQADDPANSG